MDSIYLSTYMQEDAWRNSIHALEQISTTASSESLLDDIDDSTYVEDATVERWSRSTIENPVQVPSLADEIDEAQNVSDDNTLEYLPAADKFYTSSRPDSSATSRMWCAHSPGQSFASQHVHGTSTQYHQRYVPQQTDLLIPMSPSKFFSSGSLVWQSPLFDSPITKNSRLCDPGVWEDLPEHLQDSERDLRFSEHTPWTNNNLAPSSRRPHTTSEDAAQTSSEEQAKARLDRYNSRWERLSSTQIPVPFPIPSLYDRSKLPMLRGTGWTDDTAARANIKLFFLQAFGLSLKFRSLNAVIGTYLTGLDEHRLTKLIEQLKKERLRWHPDRLGQRHNGHEGINQALVDDGQAKSMLISVNELLAGCKRGVDALRADGASKPRSSEIQTLLRPYSPRSNSSNASVSAYAVANFAFGAPYGGMPLVKLNGTKLVLSLGVEFQYQSSSKFTPLCPRSGANPFLVRYSILLRRFTVMTPFLFLTLLGAVPLALGDASSKRGLVFVPDNDHPTDDTIWDSSSSDLTWYYNYGPSPSPNYANTKLEFVPMLWGNESDNTFLDTVSGLIDSGTNVTYALGFNEPDGVDNGGSGIAAEDAAATWIRLLEPLREKYHVKLGAPAVTGSPSGFTWLQNFFTACNGGCHPDFIPVHWYGNFDGFASHIGQVNATYMNMSMWVTEFAIADANLSDSQSFFNMSTQFLDRLSYVDRYSYFGGFRSSVSNVGPDAAMLDQNGQLTDIGSWYLGGSATGNIPKGMGSNVQANLSFVWTFPVSLETSAPAKTDTNLTPAEAEVSSEFSGSVLSDQIAKPSTLTYPALLDHYNNPRNVGSMGKNEADVGTGLVGAPACGDVMKLQIRVNPDDNTISDVKFKTFGCGSAIASSSYLTELVRGMTLEQAGKIRNTEIAKELCLPPVKLHCSMLAEDAIKSAISNYYTKNPKAKATDLGGTGAAMPKVEIETVTTSSPSAAPA
ncbi:MAG: hypothetical protein Q9165_001527 [Trypethelium subeluteriae]